MRQRPRDRRDRARSREIMRHPGGWARSLSLTRLQTSSAPTRSLVRPRAAAARRALSPAIHYVCLPAKTTTGAPQLLGALFLLRFIMYVYPPPAKTTTTGSKCSPIARRARQPRDSLCMFTIMTDTVYVSPVARRAHQLLSARAVSAHPPSDAPPSKSE